MSKAKKISVCLELDEEAFANIMEKLDLLKAKLIELAKLKSIVYKDQKSCLYTLKTSDVWDFEYMKSLTRKGKKNE